MEEKYALWKYMYKDNKRIRIGPYHNARSF